MANKDTGKTVVVVLVVLALLGFANRAGVFDNFLAASPAEQPVPSQPSTGGVQCSYAPTVQLQSLNKYNSEWSVQSAARYILNGGKPQTDSDGSFEVALGDDLSVLWSHTNTSYYKDIGTYKIEKCGVNNIASDTGLMSGLDGLVQNTSLTIQCFNEENDVITNTTAGAAQVNETMGTGDAVTLSCQILGVSEQGMPHGGAIIVELSGTTYDESLLAANGAIITGNAETAPGAYTVRATANKAFAFDVAPIINTGIRDFSVTITAETDQDPGSTVADEVWVTLYPNDCQENSEEKGFDCGLVDEDNNFNHVAIGQAFIKMD